MRYQLRQRFLACLLPAVLVFAQHGAMAHRISHASEKSADPKKALVHLKLCDKCVSAEKLVHLPGGTEHRLELTQLRYSHSAALPALFYAALPTRQSCRDPPKVT